MLLRNFWVIPVRNFLTTPTPTDAHSTINLVVEVEGTPLPSLPTEPILMQQSLILCNNHRYYYAAFAEM